MKSLQFTAYGDAGAIGLVEVEPARAGAGQVRVAIEAAALNPSDFLLIDGRYPLRPPLPSTTGAEGVGRVVEAGAGVTSVQPGDRVLVLPSGQPGTWQQEVVVAERLVVRVGRDADPVQLATAGINAATAYLLLKYGRLEPGSWVAQTAANSNLGGYVIALARRAGLRTLSVVRRPEAAAALLAAGADRVVVSDDTLGAQIAEALGGDQVGLLLDGVGGPVIADLAPHLAPEADIVSFAALSGQPIALHPRYLIFQHLHLHGFWLINWLASASRAEIEEVYGQVIDLIADGTLTAEIEATYGLDDYVAAIAHARSGDRTGKIVFTPGVTGPR
jgi:NADPH:quinone reductase-like Zn-dependent oxidoreductase